VFAAGKEQVLGWAEVSLLGEPERFVEEHEGFAVVVGGEHALWG